MGQKHQPAADSSTDARKRRRVGFSSADTGTAANGCFKIYLVSSKEEVGATDNLCIDPVDLSHFFEEDGMIYGYNGLKITVWISSISFHAFAEISYQSKSDGGKRITDLKSALKNIFGENLVENKDDFLQTFSTEVNFVRSVVSNGEVLQKNVSSGCIHDSNSQPDAAKVDVEVVRLVIGKSDAGHLYSRLIPLVFLLVDGSSPIDVTDPRWELYLMIQKTVDQLGDVKCKLIGFAAIYRFYHYPDSTRLRLSQILILPSYQHKGYGRHLLDVLNSIAITEDVYDFTIEEPLDYLQHLRTCIDTLRLLDFNPIQNVVDSAVTYLKQGKLSKKIHAPRVLLPSSLVEDVRRCLKITKKQFLQCWEVLIYLGLDNAEKCMEDFVRIISSHMKEDILGKDSGTSRKQIVEVPSTYDPEMSFVMFKSRTGEAVTIEIDESQGKQEEQLQKLVDERVQEIKFIAQKVSLYRASH